MNASFTCAFGVALGLATPAISHAAASLYQLNIPGTAVPGDPLVGLDGWNQSEANWGPDYPRSYVVDFSSGAVGFAVGGYYDTEPFSEPPRLSVSQSFAGIAAGASLSAHFVLLDSEALNYDTNGNPIPGDYFDTDRNSFFVGFNSGPNELISVGFEPRSQSSDPGNDYHTWDAHIFIGGVKQPGSFAQPTFAEEDGLYTLNITTFASGTPGDLEYNVELVGSNTGTASGTLVGQGGASLTEAFVGWEGNVDSTDLGSNEMRFSSFTVSVIPEPSSMVALSFCISGCLLRRKR